MYLLKGLANGNMFNFIIEMSYFDPESLDFAYTSYDVTYRIKTNSESGKINNTIRQRGRRDAYVIIYFFYRETVRDKL